MVFARSIAALRATVGDRISYTALSVGKPTATTATTIISAAPACFTLFETAWRRSRLTRLLAYTAVGLFLLGAVSVYSSDHGLLPAVLPLSPSRPSRNRLSRDQYVEAVLRDPVEGVLDPEPIRQKCNETQFQEGLVWHCDTIVGGIGNVGNMLLNCVRYAMEAGATTLILPRLGARADDLIDLGGKGRAVDLSTLFDVDYFLESWAAVCPQMRAVVTDAAVPGLPPPTSERSPHLSPARVKSFPMRKYLVVDPTGWREAFDAWLTTRPGASNMSTDAPVRVWQDMALAQWNREAAAFNSPAFGNAFPRLLRSPLPTRRLAASVLWNLEQKLGRPVVADRLLVQDGPAPLANHLGTPGRLVADAFMGVHMRVAADAAKVGWPGYEAQAPYFIAEAQRRNLSAIYLATGSDEHRERFRQDAANAGLRVFTKEDLLADDQDSVALLSSLSWDQQALVDFDVLVHSSWFYGFVRSSFSWALALRRGTLPEAGPSQVTDALGDEYRDNLSAVVGRHPNINPEGMWP